METFLTVLHVFIAVAIVCVILLQEGKAGMGISFGGGSSSSVFGSSGSGSFLVKVTIVLAVVFAVTSVSLSIYGSNQTASSVMERVGTSPTPIKNVVATKNALGEKAASNSGETTNNEEVAVPLESSEKSGKKE